MAKQAGQLLWRRMTLQFDEGETKDVDTGITQVNRSFPDGEPDLASRLQIILMPPAIPSNGGNVVIQSQPFLDPITDTVHVLLRNAGPFTHVTLFFFDPHTLIGPGLADPYWIDD
ncbi:MAG: hypothetical protein ACREJC_05885 [Tepidisphaeraceae bacterium]